MQVPSSLDVSEMPLDEDLQTPRPTTAVPRHGACGVTGWVIPDVFCDPRSMTRVRVSSLGQCQSGAELLPPAWSKERKTRATEKKMRNHKLVSWMYSPVYDTGQLGGRLFLGYDL